jgi:hypothetical protein
VTAAQSIIFVYYHHIQKGDNEDQNVGIGIASRAMTEPLRQIVINAGEEGSVVLNKVRDGKGNYGYNAQTGEYTDMIKAGILDPTKVVRTAAQAGTRVRFGRRPRSAGSGAGATFSLAEKSTCGAPSRVPEWSRGACRTPRPSRVCPYQELATSEATVAELPKKEPAMHGGGMGDMM